MSKNEGRILVSKKCQYSLCPFNGRKDMTYVGFSGKKDATYMIIGERGGTEEIKTQTPFCGRSGILLRKILTGVGIDISDCFITNAFGCGHLSGVTPTVKELEFCAPYVKAQIKTINPKVIILLGRCALYPIHGIASDIMKLHGYPEWNDEYGCWVIATFHPANALRDKKGQLEWEITKDIQRVVDVYKGNLTISNPEVNILSTRDEMVSYLREVKESPICAYDIETNTLEVHGNEELKIACVSIATSENKGYVLWVKDLDSEDKKDVVEELRAVLENPKSIKLGANIRFDNTFVKKVWNIEVAPPYFDVILAHRLVCTASGEHGLKAITRHYTNMGRYDREITQIGKVPNEKYPNGYYDFPKEILAPYAGYDAVATVIAYNTLSKEISQSKPLTLYSISKSLESVYQLSMDIQEMVTQMENMGISVDTNSLRHLKDRYEVKVKDYEKQFFSFDEVRLLEIKLEHEDLTKERIKYQKGLEKNPNPKRKKNLEDELETIISNIRTLEFLAKQNSDYRLKAFQAKPEPFKYVNISSNPQIAKLLFTICKLKPLKKSKRTGNPSVDVGVLTDLKHPITDVVSNHRHALKMINTYISNISQKIDPLLGVVHPSFIVNGTISGRLASSFHTLPSHGEDAIIKSPFTSGFLNGWIVEADFGQMEMKVAASLLEDKRMIQAMNEKRDLHRITAGKIFGISPEEITPEQRQVGKTCNFAMIYACTARGLVAQKIASSEEEGEHFINAFFSLYPGIKEGMVKVATMASYTGYAYSPLGRYRDLRILFSMDKHKAVRQAINFPVQSVASDYAQIATRKLYEWLKDNTMASRLIGTKHDSTSIDCYSDELLDIILKFKEIAESGDFSPYFPDFKLDVPLEIDFKVGKSLYLTKEDELPKSFFESPKELLEKHLQSVQTRWDNLFKKECNGNAL